MNSFKLKLSLGSISLALASTIPLFAQNAAVPAAEEAAAAPRRGGGGNGWSSYVMGSTLAQAQAFQAAAPFPNPPKGMLDDDGFVRIRWDFVLTTDNGPRIQFRTVGSVPQY